MDQYDEMSGRAKQRYLDMAKAALSALEDPSEAMVEAGAQTIPRMGGSNREMGQQVFIAMIKAAKEEE